jgi:hypothetical protein
LNGFRAMLLDLICAAPGPTGSENNGYFKIWSDARALLRATCPDHIVDDSGTCPNCHADTME